MKKSQNYKILDLIEIYNFYIEITFIQHRTK
jgi:hypothetical protein